MKSLNVRQTVSALICAVAGTAIAAPALAAEDLALEEVVVTARKRDESFRDVPMSVNVFTEQAILSAGIQKPADFIARVPNMTLVETQNAVAWTEAAVREDQEFRQWTRSGYLALAAAAAALLLVAWYIWFRV